MDSAASESRGMAPTAARTSLPNSRLVWDRIAGTEQFKHLIRAKRAFILPAFLFFLAYYLLLPLLAGYAPQLMSRKVIWGMSFAFLYAFSQFFVVWAITWGYVRAAGKFDQLAKDIIKQAEQQNGGK